ncbi:PEP-CTERM system TPR-repeat protein PrsT [Rubrivivax rivuli]|uniref:PEP-CTERM system TPR-repeat protein PrsT n=1 Tax=Rubrivivax rivuli TaxID=1862385 RepID=A0A437RSY7_9BURK|nr:PEP-CTERM system TPR-repeat protein PrsT [Rubrivivax rivuli]
MLALALAMGALAAAGPAGASGAKASQFYEDALRRFENKDYPGAIVQLKNVLKADNKNLSAQVLLGKALLENNEVGAAEVALAEALRLGVSRAEVVTPLARAVIAQGKPEEVINGSRFALEGLPKRTQFDLLLLRAGAAGEMADSKVAIKAIEDARALEPLDSASWVAEVPLRIRARQLKEALAAADKAIAMAPTLAEAHFVRGEALHVVPQLNAALGSYDKALQIEPTHVGALVARAGVYMDLNRIEDAGRDIAEIKKAAPRDPRGIYLRALLAERQGRREDSRAALNELTAMLDPIPLGFLRYRPQTQMLGGLAHYSLGQREKAKPYLEGLLRNSPGHAASKVLANIYLSEKNIDRAIETLDLYIRANPGDTQAMMLLASAHMSVGRHSRATAIAQEALKISDQPMVRTALGLSLVGSARFGEAIKELEAAFAKDPKQLQAGYALASLYVQSGQGNNAVRVAEAVDKAHPKNPGVLNLLGAARRLKGDVAGARTAFEAAAAADPGFTTAQVSLARLDMDANNLQAAATRLNAAIAKDDKNIETLLAVAQLAERNRQLADAQRWLSKADEHAGPDNSAPALALVDFHLRNGQAAAAKEAVKRAQNRAPDSVQTLIALGRVSIANGDVTAARGHLTRAATTASFNAPQLTQIAVLQNQAADTKGAAYTLDKALTERPDYVPALSLRASVDTRLGELAQAEQRAKRVIALMPKAGLGHALLGDVALARKQLDAGVQAYRKAHELDKSTDSLMRLFVVQAQRDPAGAMRLAEQWLATRPRDAVVWRALADTQLNAGNMAGARRSYESLVKLQAVNADTLNNLANVMLMQKDPGAQKVAEQALAMAPDAPHVIGTAGWAAFRAGQADRALQLLRDARLRDPSNADTRFFLGSVLASQGRKAEAREELTAALKAPAGFRQRAEAEALLATLR